MKYLFFFVFIVWSSVVSAQSIEQRLDRATQSILKEESAYSAILSLYVTDENGKTIYAYEPNRGLTTASTQKIFTAAMALELLGKDYRWKTTLGYSGELSEGVLNGSLILRSNGDPTLGSWRYEGYKPEDFRRELIAAIQKQNIKRIKGDLFIDDTYFDFQTIPSGWTWGDIGNYYGAGIWSVNWRENQFDIYARGKTIEKVTPLLSGLSWVNDLKSGGEKDQSVVFTTPHGSLAYINGMLPSDKLTIVSGAMPNPPMVLGEELRTWLATAGVVVEGNIITGTQKKINERQNQSPSAFHPFWTYYSPRLENVIYWLLRKSVNFYAEALVKTMAKEKVGIADFSTGIDLMKDFWKSKGINPYMINFADGSGLSPKNYASARAEVEALLWARQQHWFPVFYQALPMINAIKMKSGTMRHTKSFAGYHTSHDGKKYVFAILVNNYQKENLTDVLLKVLNELR